MRNESGYALIFAMLVTLFVGLVVWALLYDNSSKKGVYEKPEEKVEEIQRNINAGSDCPLEFKYCEDGTRVGREGPGCKMKKCPEDE